MDRITTRRSVAALIASLAVGAAHAECAKPPDDSCWLVKVEHLSTYPAGPEWNTTITVYVDGCLVMDAPTALREGGGRTEQDIPEAHLDGIKTVLAAGKLHTLSADQLVSEMKSAGHSDMGRLGSNSVTDAPHTVVRFRDPKSRAKSQAVQIHALSSLTVPKAMGQLATVQDVVRTERCRHESTFRNVFPHGAATAQASCESDCCAY